MTTLKERAAKVVAARKMCLSNNGERLPDDLWLQCVPDAEATLAAIAEPSDAMIEAGVSTARSFRMLAIYPFEAAAIWRAMHVAMMAEKDTEQ